MTITAALLNSSKDCFHDLELEWEPRARKKTFCFPEKGDAVHRSQSLELYLTGSAIGGRFL